MNLPAITIKKWGRYPKEGGRGPIFYDGLYVLPLRFPLSGFLRATGTIFRARFFGWELADTFMGGVKKK